MIDYFNLDEVEQRVITVLINKAKGDGVPGMKGYDIRNNIRVDNERINLALKTLAKKGYVVSKPIPNATRGLIYEAAVN